MSTPVSFWQVFLCTQFASWLRGTPVQDSLVRWDTGGRTTLHSGCRMRSSMEGGVADLGMMIGP